jgi:hypothetical protein
MCIVSRLHDVSALHLYFLCILVAPAGVPFRDGNRGLTDSKGTGIEMDESTER